MIKGFLAFARLSGTRCKLNKLLSPPKGPKVNQAVGSLAKGKIIRKKMALAEAYVEEVDMECEAPQLPSDLADILQDDINEVANQFLVVYAESLQLAASLLTPLTTACDDPGLDFDAEFDKELIDGKKLNQMVNSVAGKTLRDMWEDCFEDLLHHNDIKDTFETGLDDQVSKVETVNGYDDLVSGISLVRHKVVTCVIVKACTRKLKNKKGNKETRSYFINAARGLVSSIGATIPPKVDLWMQAKELSGESA